MTSDASPDRLTVRHRRELAAVRRRVRECAHRLSTDDEWLDAVTLAVSEVATNAIEYGSGGAVDVTIHVERHAIDVEISADSTGIPLPPTGPVPSTRVRGRGLQVVHELADQVSIDVRGGRVTVSCRFDVPT